MSQILVVPCPRYVRNKNRSEINLGMAFCQSSPSLHQPSLPLKLARVGSGNAFHLFDDQLGNRHSQAEKNAGRAEVDHLQRERPGESRMNGRRGEMDQESDPGPTAFSLDSRSQTGLDIFGMIDRQTDKLACPTQDELMRLEGEGGLGMNGRTSGIPGQERAEGLGLRQIKCVGARLGDHDLVTEREINRMRVVGAVLSWIGRVWVPRSWFWSDHQSPAIQGELKLDIGENHSALDFHTPTGSRALRSWSVLTDRYWPFSTVLCGKRTRTLFPCRSRTWTLSQPSVGMSCVGSSSNMTSSRDAKRERDRPLNVSTITANSELNCPGKSLQRSSVLIMVLPPEVESIPRLYDIVPHCMRLYPIMIMEHSPIDLQWVSELFTRVHELCSISTRTKGDLLT